MSILGVITNENCWRGGGGGNIGKRKKYGKGPEIWEKVISRKRPMERLRFKRGERGL